MNFKLKYDLRQPVSVIFRARGAKWVTLESSKITIKEITIYDTGKSFTVRYLVSDLISLTRHSIREENIFPTKKEAENACIKRNVMMELSR